MVLQVIIKKIKILHLEKLPEKGYLNLKLIYTIYGNTTIYQK